LSEDVVFIDSLSLSLEDFKRFAPSIHQTQTPWNKESYGKIWNKQNMSLTLNKK